MPIKVKGEAKETIIVDAHSWTSTCGDGCCFDYGTNFTINGHEIEDASEYDEDMIREVLEAVGYEVHFEYTHEDNDARVDLYDYWDDEEDAFYDFEEDDDIDE